MDANAKFEPVDTSFKAQVHGNPVFDLGCSEDLRFLRHRFSASPITTANMGDYEKTLRTPSLRENIAAKTRLVVTFLRIGFCWILVTC